MNLTSRWNLESSRKIYSNKYIELYEDVHEHKQQKKESIQGQKEKIIRPLSHLCQITKFL